MTARRARCIFSPIARSHPACLSVFVLQALRARPLIVEPDVTTEVDSMALTNNDTMQGPIERAKRKTEQVREGLAVAGAELNLTNTILERELPAQHKTGDVRRAIDQNAVVAGNVAEAQEDLEQVEALLERAIEERDRLQRKIDRLQ